MNTPTYVFFLSQMLLKVSAWEDMTCGESNDFSDVPESRWVTASPAAGEANTTVQWHSLGFVAHFLLLLIFANTITTRLSFLSVCSHMLHPQCDTYKPRLEHEISF
jgi:hypothetical protein